MNTALIDAFLDLIPVAFKQSYKQIRIENPNSVFREMFAWFITKYGRMSAEDRAGAPLPSPTWWWAWWWRRQQQK